MKVFSLLPMQTIPMPLLTKTLLQNLWMERHGTYTIPKFQAICSELTTIVFIDPYWFGLKMSGSYNF